MRRTLTTFTACTVLVLGLTACGTKSEPAPNAQAEIEPFTLILDYFPNADHAGIFAAKATGEYRKAGLAVSIRTPPDPAAPLKLLQSGKADLVISYEPELFLARDHGVDVVSVGALVQKPLTSLMALGKRDIHRPGDLDGKRIGTAGIPYQSAYLKTILAKSKIKPRSVKETNVGFNLVPAMLSGKVDATLGTFWNYEGIDLRQRGKTPTIMRMDELGVPTYAELIFATRRDALRGASAGRLRRFLQATARGHEQLRSNPEVGVRALLKASRSLKARLQLASVKATLPVFFPAEETKPFGFQELHEWDRYADWMYSNRLLKNQPQVGRALTNNLLPGVGIET